jgi:hypothetical protein
LGHQQQPGRCRLFCRPPLPASQTRPSRDCAQHGELYPSVENV